MENFIEDSRECKPLPLISHYQNFKEISISQRKSLTEYFLW
jgi:hypothetical protein